MRPFRSLSVILALSFLTLFSCAGSTTNIGATSSVTASPGSVNWTVGVNVGISIARMALPAAKAAFDANASVRPDARLIGDRVFQAAIDALPLAQTALETFVHAPTPENRCRVHFYVDQAITMALQGVTVANSAGAPLPAELPAALGGLASVADMLFPGCGGASSGPPTMGRRLSAQERVRAAFGAGGEGPISLGEFRVQMADSVRGDVAAPFVSTMIAMYNAQQLTGVLGVQGPISQGLLPWPHVLVTTSGTVQ